MAAALAATAAGRGAGQRGLGAGFQLGDPGVQQRGGAHRGGWRGCPAGGCGDLEQGAGQRRPGVAGERGAVGGQFPPGRIPGLKVREPGQVEEPGGQDAGDEVFERVAAPNVLALVGEHGGQLRAVQVRGQGGGGQYPRPEQAIGEGERSARRDSGEPAGRDPGPGGGPGEAGRNGDAPGPGAAVERGGLAEGAGGRPGAAGQPGAGDGQQRGGWQRAGIGLPQGADPVPGHLPCDHRDQAARTCDDQCAGGAGQRGHQPERAAASIGLPWRGWHRARPAGGGSCAGRAAGGDHWFRRSSSRCRCSGVSAASRAANAASAASPYRPVISSASRALAAARYPAGVSAAR